jgi:hypothetical protein
MSGSTSVEIVPIYIKEIIIIFIIRYEYACKQKTVSYKWRELSPPTALSENVIKWNFS